MRGKGNCKLRPACELSGTKCCDSGELVKVFCSWIASGVWYHNQVLYCKLEWKVLDILELNPDFVTLHMKWPHYCLSTGVVTSPNYPCNYPNKLNRTTTITAKEGMVVELEFTAFNTIDGDTLTILDNDGTLLSQERSGDCLPPMMWSRTNVVHLQFVTDISDTRTGWSANWTSVAPTGFIQILHRWW